jgi:hypothetical protein
MDDAIQVRPRNVPSVESGGNGPLTQIDRLHVNESGDYQGRRKQDGIKRACNECRQQKAGYTPLSKSLEARKLADIEGSSDVML